MTASSAAGGPLSSLPDRFADWAGHPPAGVWQAPGRVNLIGEHTDYNAGLAMPFAIEHHTAVAIGRRRDRLWRCRSAQTDTLAAVDLERLHAEQPSQRGRWPAYPLGVAWALRRAGVDVPGIDLLVDSSVPVGSGLSSSAALTAAVAVALNELCDAQLSTPALVDVCHAAEAEFVGAPVGTLDQHAVLGARRGQVMLLDFDSGLVEHRPLGANTPVVVVDTGVRHDHASGAYRSRRRDCEAAAATLGLTSLRQATSAQARDLEGVLGARVRHVVSENERVVEAAKRLAAGELVGDLLYASHASLRDDFEVSCPELDAVVEVARELGAPGARMTGGGFGGSAIVVGIEAEELLGPVTAAFSGIGRHAPRMFGTAPADRAGRLA